MPYTTRQQIIAKLPADFLREALDDDCDGQEDEGLLDEIIEAAGQQVDACLIGRYELPVLPEVKEWPAVSQAALVFVLETLYQRRGFSEDSDPRNPWSAQAKLMVKMLDKLKPKQDLTAPPVSVVASDSKLHTGGLTNV